MDKVSMNEGDNSDSKKIKKQKIEIPKIKLKRKKCKFYNCKKMVFLKENEENSTPICEEHQKKVNTYEKPDECIICVEEFDKQNCVPLFPCCHWVCKNCVILTGKKECPVCRQPVILSSIESKKCEKINEKQIREKHLQQLAEDRRIAENLQRQIMHEVNQIERNNMNRNGEIEIEITGDNVQQIFEILGALEPFEQRIYRRALERYEINRRNVRIEVVIANQINDDDEDDFEDEEE